MLTCIAYSFDQCTGGYTINIIYNPNYINRKDN
jgi:hypothetical protein